MQKRLNSKALHILNDIIIVTLQYYQHSNNKESSYEEIIYILSFHNYNNYTTPQN